MSKGEGKGIPLSALWVVAAASLLLAVPSSALATSADTFAKAAATHNTAPCTQVDPCMQIGVALADTSAGGTVHVAPGTYNENLTVSGGTSLVYDGSGAPFGAIINGGTLAAVTVDSGQAAGMIQGFTFRSTSTAVQLNGQGTISGNRFDSTAANSIGLATQQSAAQVITGNEVSGNATNVRTGVFIFGSPMVTGNMFRGLEVGIEVFEGSPVIDGNEIGIGTPQALGVRVRGGTNGSNPAITRNFIHDQDNTGIVLQQLSTPTVAATLSRNRLINDGVGVSVDDAAGPVTMQSDLFASNGTAILAHDVSAGRGDITATNITIFDGSFGAQLFDAALTLDSSIIGEAGISPNGTGSCTITNSRGPTIVSTASGCSNFQTTADPQFVDVSQVDPTLNDFHLAAGSPMIDQGNPLAPAAGVLDIDGDARAIAGVCGGPVRRDIGADEFKPTCAPPPPSGGAGTTTQPAMPSVLDPRCVTLRKKLKQAKRAHNVAKVRKIRRKLRRLGC
jgi:hypothetical protein